MGLVQAHPAVQSSRAVAGVEQMKYFQATSNHEYSKYFLAGPNQVQGVPK